MTRYTEAQLRDLATVPDPALKRQVQLLADLEWPPVPEGIAEYRRVRRS